jgi:hypothetical protein
MSEVVKVEDLSPKARRALIDFTGSRQGVRCPAALALDQETWRELESHELINHRGNLTRIGGIVRERVLTAALEEL